MPETTKDYWRFSDPSFQILRDPDAMGSTWCAPSFADAQQRFEAYAADFTKDGFAPWPAFSRLVGFVPEFDRNR